MKYTENFGLKKPEPTDLYNVEDFNENADIIEEALSERPTSEGDASNMTIEFTEASELVNLTSGEKLSVAMGKIARAIKGYMSHILIKGSTSGSGHVALSDSAAVTDSTGLALPATEKNASISGTLANVISTLKKQYDEHNHDSSYYTKAETNTIEILNVANANPQVMVMAHTCKRNGHLLVFNIDINISEDYEPNVDLVYLPLNFEVGFASAKNTYYPDASNNKNVSLYNDGNGFKIKTQETFAATYYSINGIAIV